MYSLNDQRLYSGVWVAYGKRWEFTLITWTYIRLQVSNQWSSSYTPIYKSTIPCQWRHNECGGVSYHWRLDCLLNRLFKRRSKKTSKGSVTGRCKGNSPVTGEFPTQRASNAEIISIWWRHHDQCPTVIPTVTRLGLCDSLISHINTYFHEFIVITLNFLTVLHFIWPGMASSIDIMAAEDLGTRYRACRGLYHWNVMGRNGVPAAIPSYKGGFPGSSVPWILRR